MRPSLPARGLRLPLLAVGLLGGSARASVPEGFEVCLTADRCERQFDKLDQGGYFYVGNGYPEKGCFRKGGNVYFGTEGSEEEMSTPDLKGVMERVWCDIETSAPTTAPTSAPTPEPTASPTGSPTPESTAAPTASPSASPTTSPSVDALTSDGDELSQHTIDLDLDGSDSSTSVPLSPFILSLSTSSEVEVVDATELGYLVSNHLKEEMQANFAGSEVVGVDVSASPVSPQGLRRLQESRDHEFDVSGTATFVGPSAPAAADLDAVAQASFEGESGDAFVHALQNAEDPGLQSVTSVSSPESVEGDPIASYLRSPDEEKPAVGNRLYYVLGTVFSVGVALLAMYAVKVRSAVKAVKERKMDEKDDDDAGSDSVPVVFPTYIEVENESTVGEDSEQGERSFSFFRTLREAMSDTTDVVDNTSKAKNRSDVSTMSGTLPSRWQSNDELRDLGSLVSEETYSVAPEMGSIVARSAVQARDPLPAQPSDQSAQSKKSTLTQQMDTFANLHSGDEESAKQARESIYGGLDEICSGAYKDCAADMNDARTVSTRGRRVTGSFWGQRPDDLTSRSCSRSQYSSYYSSNDRTNASSIDYTASTRMSKVSSKSPPS